MKIRRFVFLLAFCGSGISADLKGDPETLPNGTGSMGSVVLDDSWHLLLDPKAKWKNDKLYLPDEVDVTKMPVNPPTDGWDALSDQAGIAVTLPGTVEEHYWGKSPLPVADSNNPESIVRLDSGYHGVAWWYRTFTPPALQSGERLIFSFPGARLRAEVYVNGKLVGYNVISEIPFMADATPALNSGQPNQLAVRITSPEGTYSWGDYDLRNWGDYKMPVSKGFNGLDGGVTMSVHAPVAVEDLYVANNPDPHQVTLNAQIISTGPAYKGPVALSISRDGKSVWTGSADVDVPAGGQATVSPQATITDAELWDVGHPVLYRASAGIASIPHSERLTDFGFRWFNAEGLGTNARLVLNGKRIFLSSAISWGFWAPNGMFPDKEAAQREVDAVQALGMNCVQTHRHFPKAAVLDSFDHAGLLRYCEVGGGSTIWDESSGGGNRKYEGPMVPSGQGGEPVTFANRYEMAKLLAMIKAYRSHPSVILWSLNNETGGDSHNPKIFYAMEKVHELDPSRIVVLKSGFSLEGEIMGRPYVNELAYGEESTHHDSGWHDNHNEDDTGVYQDSLYKSPTDFKTYTTDNKGIAMWGELGTADSPDNDAATVKWYEDHHATGYNFDAAKTRLGAYEAFLDKYQFRAAFPTAEALFTQVGARHYLDAAHIVENARIADANDYIALTGWESTTIDNNSGLVDALRHLKGDPALVKQANAPDLLVLHAHHYVVAKGDKAVVDAFIINQVDHHGSFTLHFTAAMDSAKDQPFFETSFPVNVKGGEVYGELLKDNITFDTPTAGPVTMTVSLVSSDDPKPVLQRTEPLLVVDPAPAPLTGTIACVDSDGTLIPALQKQLGITGVPLGSAPEQVDVILVSSAGTPRYAKDHKTNSDDHLPGFDWAKFFPTVLDRVKSGARLVLLGMDARDMGDAAKVLAQDNLLTYSGNAGFDDTPWIGHWYFCKKHWLLDGLPSDCVLDWQYQAAAPGDGIIVDAPGMEAVVGYGKNPGPGLGFGVIVVPVGQGKIVMLGLGGLNAAFIKGDPEGFQPVTAKRIVYNALHGE
jgi:hypothetical protein